MACCSNKDPDYLNSKDIDRGLQLDYTEQNAEAKLLLLGTGESGKSTIVKQMKVLYQHGYTQNECAEFRDLILSNMLVAMQTIVMSCNALSIKIDDPEVATLAVSTILPQADVVAFGNWIRKLWADPSIQACFRRHSEYQLSDSAPYYFAEVDRICTPEYIPCEQDILRSRVRTTHVVEIKFTYSDLSFRMYDVGGQRNERRKWMHCFQDVTAVIFVVGISEYDLKLLEDQQQNRMIESLWLFNNIYEAEWFRNTNMILFLNKTDLFRKKLVDQQIPLTVCFPEYTGGFDFETGSQYVKSQFMQNKLGPHEATLDSRIVYPHFTCATDTENIKSVFTAVKDTILQARLRRGGFV
jgi:guanine nucleotide-binding protein G(i) subunit alpha